MLPFSSRQIWALVAAFLVLNVLWLYPFLDCLLLGYEDEGCIIGPAHDILMGKTLYRNIFQFTPPIIYLLTSVWFGIFGVGIHQARWLMILISAAQSLLTCLLTARCTGQRLNGVLAGLAYALVAIPFYAMLNYHWFGTCMLTATLVAWTCGYPAVAGFLLGLTGFSLQTDGVAGLLGLGLAWVVARSRLLAKRGVEPLSSSFMLRFLAGLLLGGGLPVVAMLLLGILPDFINSCVLFVLRQYHDFMRYPYLPFHQASLAPLWTWTSFDAVARALRFLVNFTLFFLWPALAIVRILLRWAPEGTALPLLSVLLVLSGQVAATHDRMNLHNLHYLLGLWLVFLFQFRSRVLIGLFLVVQLLAGWAGRQQVMGGYPVKFPNGERLRAFPARWGPHLEEIVRISEATTRPGDTIFAFPNFNNLYILLNRANPTGFSIIIPMYNTPEQLEGVLRTLRENHVKIIYDQCFEPYALAIQQYPSIDPREFVRQYVDFQYRLSQLAPMVQVTVPSLDPGPPPSAPKAPPNQ